MIAKVVLFFAAVAAVHATALLNSGIIAPGLLNAPVLAPGLAAPLHSAPIATSSVVATPGAITTDKRVIGGTGLLAAAPLVYGNGIISPGLLGAAPFAYGNGILSPIGLKGAGLYAAPALAATILK